MAVDNFTETIDFVEGEDMEHGVVDVEEVRMWYQSVHTSTSSILKSACPL